MQNNIFVYATDSHIQALALWSPTRILLCHQLSLQLFDIELAATIALHEFKQTLHPISMHIINNSMFCVQQKVGVCRVYSITNEQPFVMSFLRKYQIGQTGFTKVDYLGLQYTLQGILLNHQLPQPTFLSINSEQHSINKYVAHSGIQIQTWHYQQQLQFHLNYIKAYQYQDSIHLLVGCQGNYLHRILLTQPLAQTTITLKSQKEVKVIMCIECLSNLRAAVAVRDQQICIINWDTMETIERILTNPPCRSILSNHISPNLYLATKHQIFTYNLTHKTTQMLAKVISSVVVESKAKDVLIHEIIIHNNLILGCTTNNQLFLLQLQ